MNSNGGENINEKQTVKINNRLNTSITFYLKIVGIITLCNKCTTHVAILYTCIQKEYHTNGAKSLVSGIET